MCVFEVVAASRRMQIYADVDPQRFLPSVQGPEHCIRLRISLLGMNFYPFGLLLGAKPRLECLDAAYAFLSLGTFSGIKSVPAFKFGSAQEGSQMMDFWECLLCFRGFAVRLP